MENTPLNLAVKNLLALMSVLTESLLTLVSCHLVALLFLTVWHNDLILGG